MSKAGYLTKVKVTGTATAMTNQAMSTNSTVDNTYRVTSTARRVFNRDATFTFKAGSTSTADIIPTTAISSIDYLFGKVVFGSTQVEPINVTGQFMPLRNVAGGNSYTLAQSREALDDTDYQTSGWRSRTVGLFDVQLTIGRWYSISSDDRAFSDAINSGDAILGEVNPGGGGDISRGWYRISGESISGDVAGLEGSDVTLELDGDSGKVSYSWGTA